MHAGDRQSVRVLGGRVQGDAIGLLRQVLAHDPHPGGVRVVVDGAGEVPPPGARIEKGGVEGEAEREGFQLIAADEAACGVVARLVAHDAGHGGAAIHVHRPLERRIDAAGHVPHVVAPDLARAVGEPVGEHRRDAVQQQPRAFERIAGDRDHARLLALMRPRRVGIDDTRHLAGRVMRAARARSPDRPPPPRCDRSRRLGCREFWRSLFTVSSSSNGELGWRR